MCMSVQCNTCEYINICNRIKPTTLSCSTVTSDRIPIRTSVSVYMSVSDRDTCTDRHDTDTCDHIELCIFSNYHQCRSVGVHVVSSIHVCVRASYYCLFWDLVPSNIVFCRLMFWKRVFQSKRYKLHNVVWKYANVEARTCVWTEYFPDRTLLLIQLFALGKSGMSLHLIA